jgi:hypothetical protein
MQLSFGGSKSSAVTSIGGLKMPGTYTIAKKKPASGLGSLPAYNQSLTSAYNKMKSISSAKPVVAPVVKSASKKPVASKPVSVGGVKVTTASKKPVTSVGGGGTVSGGGGGVATVSGVGSVGATGVNNANALSLATKSSNAYYTGAEAGFAKTRDDAIAEITKNYNQAVADGKISIQDARDAFAESVKQFDSQYYNDAQLTNTTAFSRGLGNSQQMAGLMLGDASRRNTNVNGSASERDKQINALNTRIAALTSQKNADVLLENKDYNYNITQARAEANKMLFDAQANMLGSGGGSGGGGGGYSSGGGGSRGGSSISTKSSGGSGGGSGALPDAYKQYLTTKTNTALDQYNSRAQNLGKKSVVQTKYVNPIVNATHNYAPQPGNNPNLSAYDKWKILKTDFGL